MRAFIIDTSNMAPELHGGLIDVEGASNPIAAEKQECVETVSQYVMDGWAVAADPQTPIGWLAALTAETASLRQAHPDRSRRAPAAVGSHQRPWLDARLPRGPQHGSSRCSAYLNEVLAGFGHLWGSRVKTGWETQRVGMKAIDSDTAPQLGSPTSLSDVPIGSCRGSETDGSARAELVVIGTACQLTGAGGLHAQIPGNTGQNWPVTVVRGAGEFRKESACAPNARQNARRTGSNK